MSGNLELNNEDVQDLYYCINYLLERQPAIKVKQLKRIEALKERLLKVNVNEF